MGTKVQGSRLDSGWIEKISLGQNRCPNGLLGSVIVMRARRNAIPGAQLQWILKREDCDAISIDASCGRGWLGAVDKGAAATRGGGVYGVRRSAEAGWRAAWIKPAAAKFGGDYGACDEWQAASSGWSVRGVERTDWRLLPDRCGGSGCGDFVGVALPGRRS